MLGSFLITLREGLEAALIIGIMLAYLARTDNRRAFRQIWAGTALAAVVSLIAGIAIYYSAGEFEGRAEEIFEGAAMLVAAAVLSWMIFWMRRQAAGIKAQLHADMQTALKEGATLGLVSMAFVAVVREGIETVLFLFASMTTAESPAAFSAGGLLGLAAAAVIGWSLYKGTARLNLRAFFNITGLLLIIFAAGLVAHGVHEFNEAGFIPSVVEHVWDTNGALPEQSTAGRFLTAIFGYNGNPSLTEVIAYFAYLAAILWAYLRPQGGRTEDVATRDSIRGSGNKGASGSQTLA